MKTFKKLLKKKIWETWLVRFTSLMLIMFVVNAGVAVFYNEINTFLGTVEYVEVKVELEDGETEQIISWPKLKTAEEIEAYYRAVNVEVEAEGLVLLKNDNDALPLDPNSNVSFALSGSGTIFYATHGPGVRRQGELVDLYQALSEETNLNINDDIYSISLKSVEQDKQNVVLRTAPSSWMKFLGIHTKPQESAMSIVVMVEP
jgi:beta-glucosidase